ncbi:MAG: nucleoside hydrolase [Planctomycetaceae bacterium]|nr:nucleoside hydrolase [Planctomycetaceae bacterium]
MAQKIIIDADPGLDDAFAILTALVDPSVEVLGLTATAGTVSGLQATRNLQFLNAIVDPIKHPRIGLSELPASIHAAGQADVPTRHNFSGGHGLGDVVVNVPDLHNRRESAKLIVDLVHEFPHQVRLLTLGPLTNLATACDLDPELPSLLQSIVCLGGADHVSGDITPVSEFNIWADPESAAEVLRLPTVKTLVPLNVSGNAVLTFEDVDILTELIEATVNGEVLGSMLQFSIRANRQLLASEGIPLHSVVALAVAARAERFSVEAARGDVETSGQLTRGMTVIDRRRVARGQTNLEVVTSVDEPAVIDYFSRSFRRAAR